MTKEKKDAIATWSALGMLIFGAVLTGSGFCVTPVGTIDDSVLWVLGQCLLYAGGIFGITLYTKHRFDELQRHVDFVMRHPEALGNDQEEEEEESGDGTVA